MWLTITSDSLIALSCYCIAIALLYFVPKQRDLSLAGRFSLFSISLISCGTTYLLEVWTLWHPAYWLSGVVKAFTAFVMGWATVLLVPLVFKAQRLPSLKLQEADGIDAEITKGDRIKEPSLSSQEILRLVLDNIPEFVFWKDRNSVYRGCNRNFAQIAGLDTPEEIVGKTDSDLPWKQEETDFFRECDARVMQTGQAEYHIIEPLLQANGKQSWLDTNKIPLQDSAGNVVGILGTFEDITVRKQAEEALKTESKQVEEELRQSEARFRELAQREALLNRLANQIRRSLDLNTILETIVREIRDLLQIDRCLFMWYEPDAEQSAWEVVQEAKTSRFSSFISYCVPVTGFGPLATRIFNKEITRVDNVRSLTDPVEQKFFFSMGYTALLALPIHTQSGKIGAVSCGHSSGPRPWRDFEVELLEAVADQIAIAIDQAQLLQQSRTAAAIAQERATKLKQALYELQQTQAQLVQSEKMSSLGQMVAGVAHEINNPLNFIHGNLVHAERYAEDLLNLVQLYQKYYPNPAPEIEAQAEAIEVDFIEEDLPKILSSMKMGAERISQIVRLLRNFSRADEADMKPVDIHEGLDNTLLLLAHRLKEKPGHPLIRVIKEYGDLPLVQCYPGQLNQVFMNILTNAIDAIDEENKTRSAASSSTSLSPQAIKSNPSTIRIRTEVNQSDQVIIRIIDNGAGMTEEVRSRVFDPFFTTKPVGSGTGLGMSISYQIVVEKHRGQLQCSSAPSQGAEFVISIPLEQ